MSRKHYLEVEFSSPPTLTTTYKAFFPHAGVIGEPLYWRNGTGVPVTCVRGWVECDVDDPAQEFFQIAFFINNVLHEEVYVSMITGEGFEFGRGFNFRVPLVLQDGDQLDVRGRYIDAGSGNENMIVIIFQWEGDLP